MHFEDIKALLRKRGSSAAGVARDLKVSKQAVTVVLRGSSVSSRIALEISRRTGIPVGKLWPGKYPQLEFAERVTAGAATRASAPRKPAAAGTPAPAPVPARTPADPVAVINAAIQHSTATRAAKAPRAPRRA